MCFFSIYNRIWINRGAPRFMCYAFFLKNISPDAVRRAIHRSIQVFIPVMGSSSVEVGFTSWTGGLTGSTSFVTVRGDELVQLDVPVEVFCSMTTALGLDGALSSAWDFLSDTGVVNSLRASAHSLITMPSSLIALTIVSLYVVLASSVSERMIHTTDVPAMLPVRVSILMLELSDCLVIRIRTDSRTTLLLKTSATCISSVISSDSMRRLSFLRDPEDSVLTLSPVAENAILEKRLQKNNAMKPRKIRDFILQKW